MSVYLSKYGSRFRHGDPEQASPLVGWLLGALLVSLVVLCLLAGAFRIWQSAKCSNLGDDSGLGVRWTWDGGCTFEDPGTGQWRRGYPPDQPNG